MRSFIRKIEENKLLVIISIIQFVFFSLYIYGDILITTTHGMGVWDCLFKGKIFDFYTNYKLQAGAFKGDYTPAYDFMIYIIFAIWDFPLWLINHFCRINILDTFIGNLWAKSIVLFFYYLTLIYIRKILIKIDNNNFKRYYFINTTSLLFCTYLCMVGQYDIISIFFMVVGIYYLMEDRWILFVIMFSIAIPVKALTLFAFVPILVYYEKDIIKIVVSFVLSLVPMFAFRIILPMGVNNVGVFKSFIFAHEIEIGTYKTSLFLMAFILLVVFCYFCPRAQEKRQLLKEIMYFGLLSYSIFVVFAYCFPYWTVYMMVFLYVTILLNDKYYYHNLLLETIATFFLIVSHVLTFTWVFCSNILQNAVLGDYVKNSSKMGCSVSDFIVRFLGAEASGEIVDNVKQFSWAAFIVLLMVFLVINYPPRKNKSLADISIKWNRNIIYILRVVFALILYCVPFLGLI